MKYLMIVLSLLGSTAPATASEQATQHQDQVPVIEATNLHLDGQTARQKGKAIMLLVSQEHCGFCVQIKQEVIGPMIRSGSYDERLMIRELFLDTGSDVVDFKGQRRESHAFSYDYKVFLTPTLLFLDADGKELAEKMVGIQTPEMFYYYVDQSVQNALSALDKPSLSK
ncbi:MAG: thioredoxin fold domain-containing protein [Sedimenticola sp.]|nr:thioredoxin fold domain-containing protein [Sedimenticola sp.]